jgi:hypothetical protein
MNPAALLVLAGAIVMAVGSFLPWATISASGISVTVNGTDTGHDGILTVSIAVLLGLAALFTIVRPGRNVIGYIGALVCALAAGAIGIADIGSVQDSASSNPTYGIVAAVGIGLWMVVGAAAVAVLGSLMGFLRRR